jgi:uncharacterized protein (TIGR03437 family)
MPLRLTSGTIQIVNLDTQGMRTMRYRRQPNHELWWILRCLLILPILMCCVPMFGQTVPTVIGGGYRNPDAVRVAPGQVIAVFLRNTQTLLPLNFNGLGYRYVLAESVPLPTSLAGFSARVELESLGAVVVSVPAPILAVHQLPICANTAPFPPGGIPALPECYVTALTLQVPFSVRPPLPHPAAPSAFKLVASEGGADSTSVLLNVKQDNIHIVSLCDRTGVSNGYGTAGSPTFCAPIATHLDGSLINTESTVKPAEVIVLYAYGMGLTFPDPPPAGSPTPIPGPQVTSSLRIQFDFRPSAGPSIPEVNPKDTTPSPILFAGLAPGQVGLYQINVKLPDVFPPVVPCGGSVSNFMGNVLSNLTINISGASSYDGAQICVAPGQ